MDNIIYNALSSYYHALGLKGYMSNSQAQKLLVLIFYRDFCFGDYRGLINKDDYHLIEKALDCLWGSSCLIPYPDYLKMGKLHLGEITELSHRIQEMEDAEVLKTMNSESTADSDIVVIEEEDN